VIGSGRTGSFDPSPAPIASGELERFRLRLRRDSPPQLPGPHLIRRRGQSLEFREHRLYNPGDDIRYVDWRATARHRRSGDLLIRSFEHDSLTRMVVSIDTRPTMRLPVAAPKLHVACWIAEAAAYVASRSGDDVGLHALFDLRGRPVIDVGRTADRRRIRRALAALAAPGRERPELALTSLQRALPPASAWLVVTDLYFEHDSELDRLASRIREAQQGARWVILIELDSWPHERALLGAGLRRIRGAVDGAGEPRLEIREDTLRTVEARLDALRQRVDRGGAGGYSHVRWSWPADPALPLEDRFRRWFFADPVIRRLLRRESGV
jgi:uncharacterized protein (DUF58 family)